jgi:hypothetical protein
LDGFVLQMGRGFPTGPLKGLLALALSLLEAGPVAGRQPAQVVVSGGGRNSSFYCAKPTVSRSIIAFLNRVEEKRGMSFSDIEYHTLAPAPVLAEFVESFWVLINHSDAGQPVVIVPDGWVGVFFTSSATELYHVLLLGLDTQPEPQVILPRTRIFAISWKLLGADYLLPFRLADLPPHTGPLPLDYLAIRVLRQWHHRRGRHCDWSWWGQL